MNALSNLPLPTGSDKSCSLLHGISAAIEALCRPSRLQHLRRTSLIDGEVRTVANRGRIICLSSFKRYLFEPCWLLAVCAYVFNFVDE